MHAQFCKGMTLWYKYCASISFHKKVWSMLSTHCVLSIDQDFLRKLILGHNNVEQSMEKTLHQSMAFHKDLLEQ